MHHFFRIVELGVIGHGIKQNHITALCQPERVGERIQLQVDHAGTCRGARFVLHPPVPVFIAPAAGALVNLHVIPKAEQHLAIFGLHAFHQHGPGVEHLVRVISLNIKANDIPGCGCGRGFIWCFFGWLDPLGAKRGAAGQFFLRQLDFDGVQRLGCGLAGYDRPLIKPFLLVRGSAPDAVAYADPDGVFAGEYAGSGAGRGGGFGLAVVFCGFHLCVIVGL